MNWMITFRNLETAETHTIRSYGDTRREAIENAKMEIEYTEYRDWQFSDAKEAK